MRGRTLIAVAVAAALAITAQMGVAAADNRVTGEAQQLVKQAAAQYQAGDYGHAAATLQQAYALKPVPRLLFNIARALEKAGNSTDALTYYERYAQGTDTEPDLVHKSQDAIDRLRPTVSEPTLPPAPPAPVTPSPPAHEETPPAPPSTARERLPEEEPGHTLSWIFIGGGATVAAAGLGVGIWANATASSERSSIDPIDKPSLRDAAYTRATIADVLMGVGVAAAVTGVVLRFTTERRAPQAPAALRLPTIRVGAASLWASWELGP